VTVVGFTETRLVRVGSGVLAAGSLELAIPPEMLTLAGDDALSFN
jgi:hypothetical protein